MMIHITLVLIHLERGVSTPSHSHCVLAIERHGSSKEKIVSSSDRLTFMYIHDTVSHLGVAGWVGGGGGSIIEHLCVEVYKY